MVPVGVNVAIESNDVGTAGVTLLDAADAVDVPFAFVAVTVNVYAVPAVSPETVIGDEAEVPVKPPGEEVAVKVETAAPPLAPAVKATDAVVPVPPSEAAPIVGVCGTEVAVIEEDADDEVEAPVELEAVTVKV